MSYGSCSGDGGILCLFCLFVCAVCAFLCCCLCLFCCSFACLFGWLLVCAFVCCGFCLLVVCFVLFVSLVSSFSFALVCFFVRVCCSLVLSLCLCLVFGWFLVCWSLVSFVVVFFVACRVLLLALLLACLLRFLVSLLVGCFVASCLLLLAFAHVPHLEPRWLLRIYNLKFPTCFLSSFVLFCFVCCFVLWFSAGAAFPQGIVPELVCSLAPCFLPCWVSSLVVPCPGCFNFTLWLTFAEHSGLYFLTGDHAVYTHCGLGSLPFARSESCGLQNCCLMQRL